MLYQYKNFRSKEVINKRISKESSQLFKIVILLMIINLVLLSAFYSEKSIYDNKKINETTYTELKNNKEDTIAKEEFNKNNGILDLISDKELCELCRMIEYSDGSIKLACTSDKVDELYRKIKSHKCINQYEAEGDDAQFLLKLVLK